jgi:CRISPR-associated protein Cas2
MRSVYLIAYDVCDPKRLRKVHVLMCGAGDPVQYSVFRCELSEFEKQRLKESLWDVLHLREDRVILVNLGPVEGRGDDCTEFWGTPLTGTPDRSAVVA